MWAIPVLIVVLLSGAALAQTKQPPQQALEKRMVDLWMRDLEKRFPATPVKERTPPILLRNNDASLGPYPFRQPPSR